VNRHAGQPGPLRDVIARGAPTGELRAAMRAAGVQTMRERGLQYVADGLTSVDEVNRVLAAEEPTVVARQESSLVLGYGSDGAKEVPVDALNLARLVKDSDAPNH
jgi:hypothetical protein